MANLTDEDNKKIESAKKKYEEASAKGDTAGMQSAHAEAEAVRANYGYSGGDDGSQHIKLNNGSWIGDPTMVDHTGGTKVDNSTYKDDLDKLTEAQRKAQIAQYKKAKEQALYNLDVSEQKIKPMYQEKRNTASATSQQNARSFAEYLANRGLTNSGASAQGEINRQSSLQNILGNIDTLETEAYRDIDNQRTAIENNYVSDLANANASIDAQYYSNLLAYNEQQRQQTEALKQQSLGQYANDYQARINELLAKGYDPNSMEILQLQALKGNKVNNFNANATDPNIALANIQAGNITYNNAAAIGLTVEQAQQYYNELKAQKEAEAQAQIAQQELENYIAMKKLENDTLQTQYAIKKPYYKYNNTSTKLETHLDIIDKYFDADKKAGKKGILDYLETANKNGNISDSDAIQIMNIYGLNNQDNNGIVSKIASIFK